MPDVQSQHKNKSRLGRGLGSLLGGADLSEAPAAPPTATARPPGQTASSAAVAAPTMTSTAAPIDEQAQIWQIAIDRLVANTQQPRQHFAADALKDLTASIKEKGILQPITARRRDDRTFEIIAGERRWRAAQAAGLHEVPVILKKVSEQDSLELAIIENIQRADLNPMEEAEAYDRLMMDYSLTQQQVSDKVGKERATVANSLRLLVLPPEVKAMLRKSQITSGHAKVILSVEGLSRQLELAQSILNDKLSVRASEQLASKLKNAATAAVRNPAPGALNLDVSKRLVNSLSAELQKLLGTRVQIDYANSKGKIAISFYSDEELTEIVDKMRAAWQK
jgi:ParB family chromosome partitioning protein